ncbi:MAG: hypothetical protein KDB23_33580, partial [Planctomycetales bacterium]|nr:hypothetical protein [Planctomycetales bacterium]
GYIDVTFSDKTGNGLATSSITDAGAEFTLSGSAASGVTISSTPTLVSGTTYRYTFSGNFSPGTVTVSYVAGSWEDTTGVLNLAETETFYVSSGYQIQVIFPDSTLTTSQKAIFTQAANRWSELIIGDIPDVNVSGYGLVDDLVIEATAPSIDGVNGILGSAGPSSLRSGSYLPAYGTMRFDSADINALENNGQLLNVILHEMGHVIGIGTIWSYKGVLTGAGTSDPRYTGANAVAEYNSIFGLSASSIPVENTGGSGTRDAHWRETVFNNELMT